MLYVEELLFLIAHKKRTESKAIDSLQQNSTPVLQVYNFWLVKIEVKEYKRQLPGNQKGELHTRDRSNIQNTCRH